MFSETAMVGTSNVQLRQERASSKDVGFVESRQRRKVGSPEFTSRLRCRLPTSRANMAVIAD